MRSKLHSTTLTQTAAVALTACATAAFGQTSPPPVGLQEYLVWSTVANSSTVIPNGDGRTFNSFNQPSVNTQGVVVMRARSKGKDGGGGMMAMAVPDTPTLAGTVEAAAMEAQPIHGIYSRDMARGGSVRMVFDKKTAVPGPNKRDHWKVPGPVTFTEFPSFPRIGIGSNTMLTRAQSQPVYSYLLDDGVTTATIGTSGVYGMYADTTAVTGASQLGATKEYPYFAVPGAPAGTKFDQFPGAPAVAGADTITFKGNYTDGTAKTGVFFRHFMADQQTSSVGLIASSDTLIPGTTVKFGSTAPPSASETDMVFVGLDNEEAPTKGGIYRAPFATRPTLQPLVTIGVTQVPGETYGTRFTGIGEALSYDGQHVAFWGAWGGVTKSVTLICPEEGNKEVRAYCLAQYPNGHEVQIPVKQGIFLYDLKTARVYTVAKSGANFDDFLYWNFSGRPPGTAAGESGDFEPPRWRSAAFSAMYGDSVRTLVAFKAHRPEGLDGIYMGRLVKNSIGTVTTTLSTAVEAGMSGKAIDPLAPDGTVVTAIGIERDGLRDRWFAIAASMAAPGTTEGWAGVYLTQVSR